MQVLFQIKFSKKLSRDFLEKQAFTILEQLNIWMYT